MKFLEFIGVGPSLLPLVAAWPWATGPAWGWLPLLLVAFATKTQQERVERFYVIQSHHTQFRTNLSHENIGSDTTVRKPQRVHHMHSGNQNKNWFPIKIKSSCKILGGREENRRWWLKLHVELLKSIKVEYIDEAPYVYHDVLDAGVYNVGHDHQGVVVVWIFTLGFESDLRIEPCLGSLLDFCAGISFTRRGAITTHG
ncbi:hypothetical protein B296_00013539 [Ensete ventricosum]|uniref:Uncharacterized protein n=1 Tax=Ensete ventricosum TaxID=4639 RepID=A0A426X8U3_ENSVE|nr:hypothetical protein B296_00013539 [Ensete ventricosum]